MTEAQLAARVNHIIQPTSNAGEPAERGAGVEVGPAGPVEAAADLGEATARSASTPRRRRQPSMGSRRRRGRQSAGSAKTAPPITWLTPMAVRSQRPSLGAGAARSQAGWLGYRSPGRLYHDSSWTQALANRLGNRHQAARRHARGRAHPPGRFYTDAAYFAREMDALFGRCGSAPGGPSRSTHPASIVLRELGGESIIITSRRRARAGVLQRLPASRHAALHRGGRALRRQHPVPLPRLDLRPRRPAASARRTWTKCRTSARTTTRCTA